MAKPVFFSDWEKFYAEHELEGMPWYYSNLDHDFDRALKEFHVTEGLVLDLGTGPGTQAVALAERGFKVVATDISGSAVKKAAEAIQGKKLPVVFRQDDIVSSELEDTFDAIFDRGCFHVLEEAQRASYVRHIFCLLANGAFLFLKTFSVQEPFRDGPHRFTPQDIQRIFGPVLTVISTRESFFMGNHKPDPRALFCVIRKPVKPVPLPEVPG
jgi:SAM-dependent methyltransferase